MEKAQFEKYNQIDPDADIRVAFDQTNPAYSSTQDYNHLFVRHSMNYLQDKLRAQGYLFVNDVLVTLGIDRTPEGQLLGWHNFGKPLDFSYTSDSESGCIVLKNAQFIWHTI